MVARMYYVLGMTQKDIADQVGVGRSSVARFLNEAKEEGIIRFFITSKNQSARDINLENKLIQKFKLSDAIVVKNKEGDDTLFEVTVANYLNSVLPFHGTVGVGGGQTMNSLSSIMNICDSRPNLKIVQTIGGFSNSEIEMPSTSTIQNWAQSLEARPLFLPSPAIVENKETKYFYLMNQNIKNVYEKINELDVLIVGIGSMRDIEVIQTMGGENIDYCKLQNDCVGDINLHFFNEEGEFNAPDLSNRVMGITPEDFKKAPTRVGVAYGEEKVNSIKGAIKGKLVNVLVTTSSTAQELLREEDS